MPCNQEQPDLSTATAIIGYVEQMIESVRNGLADSSLTVPAARSAIDELPLTKSKTVELGGSVIGERAVDATASHIVSTGIPVSPNDSEPPATPVEEIVAGLEEEEGDSPQSDEAELKTYGKWQFLPAQVRFGALSPFPLVDLPRRILQRLVETTNPDGWISWKNLADDAWEKDADPNREAVIKGVSRLKSELKNGLGIQCPSDPIESMGQKNDLSYRIAPSLR